MMWRVFKKRAESCFESTVLKEKSHSVLRQTHLCERLGEFALAAHTHIELGILVRATEPKSPNN